jgi:hypothetical protein
MKDKNKLVSPGSSRRLKPCSSVKMLSSSKRSREASPYEEGVNQTPHFLA